MNMMKILKWFYVITVILVILGIVGFVVDGTIDIYTIWIVAAFLTGWYLIENK